MDASKLTDRQRGIRMDVRNFLMMATMAELVVELRFSKRRGDGFRAECVQELIKEANRGD